MKRWLKITIVVVGLLILVGGATWWLRRGNDQDALRTAAVTRSNLIRDVTFTGELQTAQSAELAFEYGGIVRRVAVVTGDAVQLGTTLVQLDTTGTQFEAAKAAADLASAQEGARLAWEKTTQDAQNTKTENVRIVEQQKQQVRAAKEDMEQAEQVWQTRVEESSEESSLARTAFAAYVSAKNAYTAAQKTLDTLLKTVQKTNDAATATARVAEEQYLATTQTSGSVAGLSSLEALQRLTSTKLTKLTLTAPFAATVTDVATEVGEYVTPGQSVLTIATVNDTEVVANVTETDAAKLKDGMSASIAFDALPDAGELSATVSAIAPAAKSIEGVPTYEVKLKITDASVELKPGLTADVVVHIDNREQVLVVPRRAVTTKEGQDYIRVRQQGGQLEEVPVETGLVGSDGQIEIISGLTEGQEIVVSVPDAI